MPATFYANVFMKFLLKTFVFNIHQAVQPIMRIVKKDPWLY